MHAGASEAMGQGKNERGSLRLGLASLSLVLVLLPWLAGSSLEKVRRTSDEDRRVLMTAETLEEKYDAKTGLFSGTGWWNSANGISALARVSRVLNTDQFHPVFSNTFTAAQHKNPRFLNEFYDDEGWWALAWLDVHERLDDSRYLDMSKAIFEDMSHGWSEDCGGGIWWKKNEHYKNAIANELFLSVAVRLAEVTSGSSRRFYLDWAEREERWFVASGMINSQGLVNDGLDAACKNNGKTTWTYNQGVILTGLSGFGRLKHDPAATRLAGRIAHAVVTQLVDIQGVVHDPCEPDCGDDGVQFKGILMRNLAALQQVSASPELQRMMQANSASVWQNARTAEGQYSVNWAGPPRDSGTGSLISALDALTAPLQASAR